MDERDLVTPPYVARPLDLAPFAALRLAPSRVGGPGTARALARPYHDVADRFRRWEASRQLFRDPEPALYLHEYTAVGMTVRGLVGALDISRSSTDPAEAAVLPHEGIHPPQVADLAERMTEMALNPAPILLVHRGSDRLRTALRHARQAPATHQFTDRSGQYHRIWTLQDPALLATVHTELVDTTALIADGHHRYAAYLQLRRPGAASTATNAGLAMLVDQAETPLFLGAIHRILGGVRLQDLSALPTTHVTPTGPAEAVTALSPSTLVATDGRDWVTIQLPASSTRLAVQLLQEDLLPALPRAPSTVGYAHSVDEALQGVARRRGVAVLMPAPEFDEVLRTAASGELLPEKATSFQPKPSVGVLIRSLRDG